MNANLYSLIGIIVSPLVVAVLAFFILRSCRVDHWLWAAASSSVLERC
ncbi:MAG: hypothetical protein ACOC4E_00645 [Patescibacteria group bacterium]